MQVMSVDRKNKQHNTNHSPNGQVIHFVQLVTHQKTKITPETLENSSNQKRKKLY
jgi:hypothetical protein